MAEDKVHKGCEGPDAEYVILRSSDGYDFIIKKQLACEHSSMIKDMMSGPTIIMENEDNVVDIKVPSLVLKYVCAYFNYKEYYKGKKTMIPNFPLDPEIAIEVLLAANYLNC
ncbi:UNVERIFIED_CONTAM: hypothetical protein RMT77_004007 [Armadillidium vulgare]